MYKNNSGNSLLSSLFFSLKVVIKVSQKYVENPLVLDPGKGVCADSVGRVAILEVEGPGPPVGVSERQLSPDRGGEKT
jgi:hypothetical protein